MRMSELLLSENEANTVDAYLEIQSITSDSRLVYPGTLFAAIRGESQDGRNFIDKAINEGARIICLEEHTAITRHLMNLHPDIPFIVEPNLRKVAPRWMNIILGKPLEKLLKIGVTGTNGKSTITHLVDSLLTHNGYRVLSLGTIHNVIAGKSFPATLTTPGTEELFQWIQKGVQDSCNGLVMEVSSHALSQHRVASILFDRAIFTNLTQDHLDYHKDFENYYLAKRSLFLDYLSSQGCAIINVANEYGRRLARECKSPRVTFSAEKSTKADVYLEEAKLNLLGSELRLNVDGRTFSFRSNLIGRINLENLCAAVAVAYSMGFSLEKTALSLEHVIVPGRNEIIPLAKNSIAVVDYAHTPDALERVLASLRSLCQGKLICVFGCGGDRDKTKRPLMGEIASRLADYVIVTSDNPRTEDANSILSQIKMGITATEKCETISDRRGAIEKALSLTDSDDCLLVAGKGHEDYQIIGKEKKHFSDQETIREWLQLMNG